MKRKNLKTEALIHMKQCFNINLKHQVRFLFTPKTVEIIMKRLCLYMSDLPLHEVLFPIFL